MNWLVTAIGRTIDATHVAKVADPLSAVFIAGCAKKSGNAVVVIGPDGEYRGVVFPDLPNTSANAHAPTSVA